MRTSMAMAAAPVEMISGGPQGRGREEWPRVRGGRLVPRSAGVGGAGTDRAGEPAQVDVQARHEADAWGLGTHIDGTHGLIV
ncbi:hypothetical protein GCM10010193_19230 [Kitasatospora atroaurantiaca]